MKQERVTPLWPDRQPDFDRLAKVFWGTEIPDVVPFVELFADQEIVASVLGEPVMYAVGDRAAREAMLQQRIRFCLTVGYDYVWAYPVIPGLQVGIGESILTGQDTASLARPMRTWINEARGAIATMEDCERYPWPAPSEVDYADIEYLAANLPDGMKIMGTTTGIMEWVMWLMGFVPFSEALYDQPELIEAMFKHIGDLLAAVYDTLASMPAVGAVFLGDDMGYRQGTFIKPQQMRQYIFPRQQRLAEAAHAHGKPFLLHSCGNLTAVMDDLIGIGIDGKHSYEDIYLPVAEAKRLYGDRISILGGVDVDMLTRSSEDDVRVYTRRVLEACMPGGGYALGTGNSVANYIPTRNYLAMLDEGVKVGRYQ
ncbi:MAG: uroporphyrinogen-III decarboxylase-like protein [Chloroflexi bacterium]|nr:uroporphyrinogen-III decarboxylase-like protein [Chloroflexota bacterium]